MGNATNGENTFRIAGDNIVIPPGVRLNSIEPSEVKVVLDTPVTKMGPNPGGLGVGRMPPGLILERVSLTPAQAAVSGPTKALESISTVYSRNVQLDKLEKSGQMTVKLVLEPSSLKMASGFTDEVMVRYTIGKRDEGGLSSGVQ